RISRQKGRGRNHGRRRQALLVPGGQVHDGQPAQRTASQTARRYRSGFISGRGLVPCAPRRLLGGRGLALPLGLSVAVRAGTSLRPHRSEEHTSELQSRVDLVCRLLLEKKKNNKIQLHP